MPTAILCTKEPVWFSLTSCSYRRLQLRKDAFHLSERRSDQPDELRYDTADYAGDFSL